MAADLISVEVAYALPDHQLLIPLELPAGSTVEQAIATSNIIEQMPNIDLGQQKIGIFGLLCSLDKTLADGDRVEIYRPLSQNPMDARRGRFQK